MSKDQLKNERLKKEKTLANNIIKSKQSEALLSPLRNKEEANLATTKKASYSVLIII